QPAKQFTGKFAQQPQSDPGVSFSQRQDRADKRPLGQGMREPDAQEAVRFSVARRNRFQRLRPLQQISRLFEHPGAERVQARRLDRAVEQLSTQRGLQPLQLPGYSGRCPVYTIGCTDYGTSPRKLYEGAQIIEQGNPPPEVLP